MLNLPWSAEDRTPNNESTTTPKKDHYYKHVCNNKNAKYNKDLPRQVAKKKKKKNSAKMI